MSIVEWVGLVGMWVGLHEDAGLDLMKVFWEELHEGVGVA